MSKWTPSNYHPITYLHSLSVCKRGNRYKEGGSTSLRLFVFIDAPVLAFCFQKWFSNII